MAEGPDPVVADLEQEVTCGTCHDHYQEPKLFPCCHYYQGRIELPKAARGHATPNMPCTDDEMLMVTKNRT